MTGIDGIRKHGEWKLAGFLLTAVWLVGCHGGKRVEPVSLANPTLGPMTIAVAPALNQSGSRDFDPNRFADLMAGELSYAEGIKVIPVSRVLGVLAVQGLDRVESPTHALELADLLGADAILLFAVTKYDPYDPPSIGLSAQLYGSRPGAGGGTLDPVAFSRQTGLVVSRAPADSRRPLAQVQRVYDAAHGSVVQDIQAFAELRDGEASPYGWRKYVVSQQHYIRYCCFATVRALLRGEAGESGNGEKSPNAVGTP